jgi:hypothetical protein
MNMRAYILASGPCVAGVASRRAIGAKGRNTRVQQRIDQTRNGPGRALR